MITLRNVSKSFDEGHSFIVRNLSLEVVSGETLVLLGSSGSGKTTTLKMINRLIEPTSGEILIDGENSLCIDPVRLRRSMGYVFQGIGLFPHMTIEQNISVVLRLKQTSKQERMQRVTELLQMVNLDPQHYAHRFPDELSGGQRQRVGVARALADNPAVLLMDEPFGALDAINRDALQQELLALKARLNKTIIFVTHDIFEALRVGDRIAIMHKGKIEQVDTKKNIVNHPASDYVDHLFQKTRDQLGHFAELLE